MTYLEAMQLLAAKSPFASSEATKTIRRLANNTPNAQSMAERVIEFGLGDQQSALTPEERMHLAVLLSGDAISGSAVRQRKRREVLDETADALGFETWAKLETAVVNGRIRIRIEEQ